MPLANNDTELANIALAKLGVSPISSIDQSTDPAPLMKRLIPPAVMEVQADYPWPELVKADYAPDSTGNTDAETSYYEFQMPSDFLRMVGIVNGYDYFLRGNFAYIAYTPATIKYVAYSSDPSVWGVSLAQTVCAKLAVDAAMPLTQNANLHTAMLNEYERLTLPRARRLRALDRKARPHMRSDNTRWRQARGAFL